MNKQDTLIITSPQTNFEEIEFIRKNALLDWIRLNDSEAEYGYKNALKEMRNYLNQYE